MNEPPHKRRIVSDNNLNRIKKIRNDTNELKPYKEQVKKMSEFYKILDNIIDNLPKSDIPMETCRNKFIPNTRKYISLFAKDELYKNISVFYDNYRIYDHVSNLKIDLLIDVLGNIILDELLNYGLFIKNYQELMNSKQF